MVNKIDTQSEAAAKLVRTLRDYLHSAGGQPTSVNLIDEVLEEEHRESQDRFDADALNEKYYNVEAALNSEAPAGVETASNFTSPVERVNKRKEAASEYFRETLKYFPDDTQPDVFESIAGFLLLELDAAHQEVGKIGPCEDESAADRQDCALHLIYGERLPYDGRETLPYSFGESDQTEEEEEVEETICGGGGTDDLPCTAEVLGDRTDGLVAALLATVEDLIGDDGYGKPTFEDLRQIGRWFHTTDIKQYAEEYGEPYEEALELLYGILEVRRLSVIIGKTTQERRLDHELEFCYVAVVTQAHMKIRWYKKIIEPMKRRGEADDGADSTDG